MSELDKEIKKLKMQGKFKNVKALDGHTMSEEEAIHNYKIMRLAAREVLRKHPILPLEEFKKKTYEAYRKGLGEEATSIINELIADKKVTVVQINGEDHLTLTEEGEKYAEKLKRR